MVANPLYMSRGYSAITSYQLEYGSPRGHFFSIIQFGMCNYNNPITASYSHKAEYTITGYYLQPGFVFYSKNPIINKESFFVNVAGYFGSFNHNAKLEIADANWRTSRVYSESGRQLKVGVSSSFGSIFNIYRKLKMKVYLTAALITPTDNPIPQLEGFRDITYFTPGIGFENALAVGVHAGLTYQIY